MRPLKTVCPAIHINKTFRTKKTANTLTMKALSQKCFIIYVLYYSFKLNKRNHVLG